MWANLCPPRACWSRTSWSAHGRSLTASGTLKSSVVQVRGRLCPLGVAHSSKTASNEEKKARMASLQHLR